MRVGILFKRYGGENEIFGRLICSLLNRIFIFEYYICVM